MKQLIFVAFILLVVSAIKVNHQQEDTEPIVGAWENLPLEDIDQDIDKFIREQYPELKDAELVNA